MINPAAAHAGRAGRSPNPEPVVGVGRVAIELCRRTAPPHPTRSTCRLVGEAGCLNHPGRSALCRSLRRSLTCTVHAPTGLAAAIVRLVMHLSCPTAHQASGYRMAAARQHSIRTAKAAYISFLGNEASIMARTALTAISKIRDVSGRAARAIGLFGAGDGSLTRIAQSARHNAKDDG